jgi:hypothetical protein
MIVTPATSAALAIAGTSTGRPAPETLFPETLKFFQKRN